MIVGVMQVEIAIDWSQSLKDKRRVVKSLRDTLHRHHMVSVSEVEDHEILTRAALDDEFATASGKYFDNDAEQFGYPHPDALNAAKMAKIVEEVEAVLSAKLSA